MTPSCSRALRFLQSEQAVDVQRTMEQSAAWIDWESNSAPALPHGLSLGTFAGPFLCVASGLDLIMRVSGIRILAGPTVGERKAKCPGRMYRTKEHEGDTNVDALIRLHA